MNQDKISRVSDVENNVWAEGNTSKNVKSAYKPSYGERWDKTRPTKAIVFWSLVATIVLTIIVGFGWGGWVTSSTAQKMTDDAIAQRLAVVCVGQYDQDLGKLQKLRELNEMSSFRRDDYVREQGWATMPGEQKPDNKVADACAKLLINQ